MSANYQITTNQGQIPVWRVLPQAPGPLLIIIPSIFGNSPDVQIYAERCAQAGALVYVIDSFWRTQAGPLHISEGVSLAIERKKALSLENAVEDTHLLIKDGLEHPLCNGKLILLGICFGGRVATIVAKQQKASALLAWHGGNMQEELTFEELKNMDIDLHFGEADPMIPMTEVEEIRQQLKAHNHCRISSYEGAGHGFSHLNSSKYHQEAGEGAIAGLLDLLAKYK